METLPPAAGPQGHPPPDSHPHATVHVQRTWLRAEAGAAVLRTCSGPALRVAESGLGTSASWPVDALLLGAVEAGVRADFLHRAEQAGLELAFYESSAQARWSEGPLGLELLDFCVQPRVGVHRPAEVQSARSLFTEVAKSCLVARALQAPLILQPTVEVWTDRPLSPATSLHP